MTLAANEARAVEDLRNWLQQRFGARVRRLVLFGSRARGAGDEDSDVDVLVTVLALTSAEAREIAHCTGDLLTRYDVLVSPLALSHERFEELRSRERAIALEIERTGVPL